MDEIEIPEAIREGVDLPEKSSSVLSLPLLIGVVLCVGVIGLLLSFWFFRGKKPDQIVTSEPAVEPATPQSDPPAKESKAAANNVSPGFEPAASKLSTGNLLGHLPYDVAPDSELVAITNDGSVTMRSAAAKKFLQMQAAAKAEGINLTPISAFRTTKAQEQLFFGVKEQKVQDAAKRAEVSAPPGYSEHHTGYAIDIGDGNAPATNVEKEFANTAAFGWLEQNALKYSFELSFPPDNEQGVSYEPWHWRFVGDRHSLETFYKVRN